MNTPNSTNVTGFQTVQAITESYNMHLGYNEVPGYLSDHYDPTNQTLSLSPDVSRRPTIASVAIAAHELGHAQQHLTKNPLMLARSFIVPVVNLGSTLGYILIVLGIIIAFANLAWLGVLLFSFSTLFSLLTLPIEIDASRRGIGMIQSLKLLDSTEIPAAKKVLLGASLTYVAAVVASLGNLAYFIFQVRGLSDRD